MISGTKNASRSHQLKRFIIKQTFSFYLLFNIILVGQDIDTIDFKMPEFSFTPKVFHQPARVLFNSRIFELEVFTDFPKKDVKEVSLLYKTNVHSRYIEYPFKHNAKRYVFSYNPKEQPANYITYFFTLALNNGSVYATPIDSSGMVTPITKYLLNPAEYYKKRSEIKN